MYISTYVTRHIEEGKVIGFVVKYNPPCPPIQVYHIKNEGLTRILPNRTEFELSYNKLTSDIVSKSREELKKLHPSVQVEDFEELRLEDYLKKSVR